MPIPRSLRSPEPFRDLDLAVVAGAVPAGLTGEIFVSAPDPATSPEHAFYGDGVILRLSLQPGTWGAPSDRHALRANLFDAPNARLRAKRPEVFRPTPLGTFSPFGTSNVNNTAPWMWGDRLFASWDAGRPCELDPVTLGWLGEVGRHEQWAPAVDAPVFPTVPASAHPVLDPDRNCLWDVSRGLGAVGAGVVRYDGHGTRVRRWRLAGATFPQSQHTIAQTREWLILIDTAFKIDGNELAGRPRTAVNEPDEPVYLVRKADLDATPDGGEVPVTTFRLAPEVNHFYAVYDDSDGIRVLMEHSPNLDIAMSLKRTDTDALGRPIDPRLHGMYCHGISPCVTSVVGFDPVTGAVTERARLQDGERFWQAQLSAFDWSVEGQARPTVHHTVFLGFQPDGVNEQVLANYAGRVDRSSLPGAQTASVLVTLERETLTPRSLHAFALDDYPTSPTFVPRPGGEPGGHDGWVVVFVANDDRFRVEVFDARDVGAGPVAVLAPSPGTTIPLILHTCWAPTAVPSDPGVERLRFADDLDDAKLGRLDDDLRTLVHEVAVELDAR